LIAHSSASAPELVKNTLSAKVASTSRSPAAPGRDLVEVGDVPELAGLLGQRRDEMRMAVAERIDGDAAGEIEISLAVAVTSQQPSPRSKDRGARAKVS
jgi:hypothetical protein